MSNPVQCPNCKMYKVESDGGCATQLGLHMILGILTAGLWFIV
jgi:hypothetical protein